MDIDQIRDAVFRLPREEKIRLAQELWDNIAREPMPFPISTSQFEELERRRSALQSDPSRAIEWNDAKRLIREAARS
jgi:putative addiction module component (TIGR02574 family)